MSLEPSLATSDSSSLLAPAPTFAPVRLRSACVSSNDNADVSVAINFAETLSPISPSQRPRRCSSISRYVRGRGIIYVILCLTAFVYFVVSVPLLNRMPVSAIQVFTTGSVSPNPDSATAVAVRAGIVDSVTKGGQVNQYSIIRGKPPIQGTCKNSRSGKYMLADDRGSVCLRGDIDEGSGCCANPLDNLSCNSCRSDLRCCQSFEYCISCCMKEPETSASSRFDQCVQTCRTSSRSIKHGNMYKHSFHHCYTKEEGQLALDHLAITTVKAEPGFSCDQTCATLNSTRPGVALTCIDSVLETLNNCPSMKSIFSCDRCEMSEGADQPAFVSQDAPANFPRGACLIHKNPKAITCDGRHEATQRACACTLPIDLPA